MTESNAFKSRNVSEAERITRLETLDGVREEKILMLEKSIDDLTKAVNTLTAQIAGGKNFVMGFGAACTALGATIASVIGFAGDFIHKITGQH